MYDELIKNLRHDSASALQNCEFDFVHAWMLEAADAIEELSAINQRQLLEIAVLMTKPRWVPVTERLPEHHGNYLVHIEGGEFSQVSWEEIAFFDGKIFMWEHISSEYPEDVTHWMPLPESPKDGE